MGLKPSLELRLLRSEVLAARGYPEVDGDGPAVHVAIMYDFIGRSNRALWGSQKPQKNQDTAQSFQRTLQVGHCLIASGPAALSVGFCTVAIVTPTLLQHVSSIEWDHVILYGQYVLDRARVR